MITIFVFRWLKQNQWFKFLVQNMYLGATPKVSRKIFWESPDPKIGKLKNFNFISGQNWPTVTISCSSEGTWMYNETMLFEKNSSKLTPRKRFRIFLFNLIKN